MHLKKRKPAHTNQHNMRKHVLANGLTILTEEMPHLRSVSIGVWLKSGSRHETEPLNGVTHFLEHMLFKGTETRSASQIAREMDSLGGNLDAFTGKETVCFNAKVMDEHLPVAFDILSDLVLNPKLASEDIEREKGVILEEIKMDEDNPELLIHELFTQNYYSRNPLGRPILGTKATVSGLTRHTVRNFYDKRFMASNMVISVAGRFNNEKFIAMVEKRFARLSKGKPVAAMTSPSPTPRHITRKKKSLEQVQICIGMPAQEVTHTDRYAAYVLNVILGGGMSSRLFQKIREEQGLAYSIYSDLSPYRDTGVMMVYAGTSNASAGKVVREVAKELKKLCKEPPPVEELRRAKDHLKGNLMMSLESSSARMSNMARQEMYFGKFLSMDDVLERVENVTRDDMSRLAQDVFHPNGVAVTLLGNLPGKPILWPASHVG